MKSSNSKLFYNFLIILSIVGLIWPNLTFGQEPLTEAKNLGKKIWESLPQALRKVTGQAGDFLKKLYFSIFDFLKKRVFPWIGERIGGEIERKEKKLQIELKKETKEMKEGTKEIGKDLWQRLKQLLK